MLKKSILDAKRIHDLIDLKAMECPNGCVVSFKEDVSTARYIYTMNDAQYAFFTCFKEQLYVQMCKILKLSSNTPVYVVYEEDACRVKPDGAVEAILTSNKSVVKNIFETAVKGTSSPVFVRSDLTVAVVPTHHLDLFVAFEPSQSSYERIDFNRFSVRKW